MMMTYLRLRSGGAGLLRCEAGQTLTEYALLIMFIAMAVFVALGLFGTQLNVLWSEISSRVVAAGA